MSRGQPEFQIPLFKTPNIDVPVPAVPGMSMGVEGSLVLRGKFVCEKDKNNIIVDLQGSLKGYVEYGKA